MSLEISPIIIAAVDLMKLVNEGLEVEYISEMRRIPSEQFPLGILGVSAKMTILGFEENVFLGCQQCEDMLTPFGSIMAEEFVMMIFRDKLIKINRYSQIIDEVYENYLKECENLSSKVLLSDMQAFYKGPITPGPQDPRKIAPPFLKEEFTNKCKIDSDFSEKWELKIEERKLSLDERAKLHPNPENFYEIHGTFSISDSIENSNFPNKNWLHEQFDNGGIPTKLITITHNNETIESYE